MMNRFGILIFGVSTLLLFGFVPAKYSANFNKEKKKIDQLTIFNTIVHMVANNSSAEYIDSTLMKVNQSLLDSLTNSMLINKYNVKNAVLQEIELKKITDLFEELENSPSLLVNISTKGLLGNLNQVSESKYALMLVYYGQFNPDLQPHANLQSGFVTNSIVINSSTKSYSDMRLMIIDTENENVVFYDRFHSSNFDARLPTEVEQMAKKIMKKIYYK